jgi:YbbR domain-containing protein
VDSIRYVAPTGSQRPRPGDFRAWIDLANVRPTGQPVNVPVHVSALDPDITIIGVTPSTIQVVLDSSSVKVVPVRVERGAPPEGIGVGETTYSPEQVTVRGPASAVTSVVAAQVDVALDPQGFDVDREIEARPVDANGDQVTGVDVEPTTVHVQIPLFTDKESRSLPVNPVITGTPAPGFRIAAVTVTPATVTVSGDAEQLTALAVVDTAPVSVAGATSNVEQAVDLAPPRGIEVTGSGTVTVKTVVEPITQTRTYSAGLRLDAPDPALAYRFSTQTVLLTLYGSVADLDRIGAAPLVVGVNVADLGPGEHEVPVVPVIDSSVTVVTVAPPTVTVTITEAASSPDTGASTSPNGSQPPPAGASTSP